MVERFFLCPECSSVFDEEALLQDDHVPNCIACMAKPGNPLYRCEGPYTKRELQKAMKPAKSPRTD